MKKIKKEYGITLVALVITIIILLILAGISIQTLSQTNLFNQAKLAKNATENAQKSENEILENYMQQAEKYAPKPEVKNNTGKILSTTLNTELQDQNGNKIVVPAGFKIVSDATTNYAETVEKGIVIEDENSNQYVWIPCTTEDSTTQLQYKRTEWEVEEDGNTKASKDELSLENTNCLDENIQEGLTTEIKNEIVEQVKKEKESISKYGGYYIGRYETGNENEIAVVKSDEEPYTDILWYQAYKLAKGIGGGKNATTYLCSSYAWDTAINFIQNTGAVNYAITREGFNENWYDKEVKDSSGKIIKEKNKEIILKTGKTTAKSNIFDMGGNVDEYTTEVIPDTSEAIVLRGGIAYNWEFVTPGCRVDAAITRSKNNTGFRTTLFLD